MPGADASHSFDDYDSLVDFVSGELHRSDLKALVPSFIWLTECELQAVCEFRLNDLTVTGTSVADQEYIDLPTDYVGGGYFNWDDSAAFSIHVRSWDAVADIQKSGESGSSRAGVIHGDRLYVAPSPGADTYTLHYKAGVKHLSATVRSNRILVLYPSALLYGALKHATPWIGADDRIQMWKGFYDEAAAIARVQEWNARAGHGPLQMRTDVRVI